MEVHKAGVVTAGSLKISGKYPGFRFMIRSHIFSDAEEALPEPIIYVEEQRQGLSPDSPCMAHLPKL